MIKYKIGDILRLPTCRGFNYFKVASIDPSTYFITVTPYPENGPRLSMEDSKKLVRNVDYRYDFNFSNDLKTILIEGETK